MRLLFVSWVLVNILVFSRMLGILEAAEPGAHCDADDESTGGAHPLRHHPLSEVSLGGDRCVDGEIYFVACCGRTGE